MAVAGGGATGARYRRLAADLREAIEAGAYGAGGRLPSEEKLAQQYGVSRGTVRQALGVLRANGLVTSRRGTRRVVLGTARTQSFFELLSFTRWARSIGEEPGGRTIDIERRLADPLECEQLGLAPGSKVYWVLRLRTLSRVPIMIERTIYPEQIGAMIARLEPDAISHTEPLAEQGVVFADAEHTVDLVWAAAEDAGLLGCAEGGPLIRERRRATDPAGTPLEWSEDRYLPGTVAFTVHNSVATTALSRRRG
ncbi:MULTISPECIES: GntR family transcriptional regulator [Streptomyces]|uniref:GntR family transcriptional regulator n=1 Tax=Streptomyces TaxID=1883 RepID=UPI002DDC14A5|nr:MULTISPECIES: GntR family transcriptional regulator [unclassified Streptomyces]WRZ97062.1 GntR family transcriptional regulator [Streptomyces sp. NBC_00841]WSJ93016.1 GntR family transcriptional regulator [Streptomyces sp. NBC_01320]